ncbi:MAG: vWA domain-containing protein, partial [Candidatus Altiarchaeota archaeon]
AGGDTDMVQALEMADDFLKLESNERVIVVFSDGIIRLTRVPSTVDSLASLTSKGVKVYIVGVGKDNVGQSTLKYIAGQSGALYFEPEEYQRLKVSFTKEGEEEEGAVGVAVLDPHHFITRNLRLVDTEVTDYNNVREKLNAQVLVATEGGYPVLTVWRFGLGRVASLTTDDGLTWAQDLYSGENAKIIPSLTNWVVGDIEGRKDTVVEADDSFLGDSNPIIARSLKTPKIRIQTPEEDEEDFPVKRIGLSLYSGEYHAKDQGVYIVGAATEDATDSTGFAVNYPKEYTHTGVDLETLGKIARLSQGKLYTSGDAIQLTQDVIFDVKERAEVKSKEKKSVTLYFLAAALGLYFLDSAARRITEILRLTRG